MFIYAIRSKINDKEVYIGSTKNSIRRRCSLHKSACKTKYSPLYNHINQNGGFDNYYIELYEEFNGTTQQLKQREGDLIRQFKNNPNIICLNHNIAGRTPLENLNEKYKNNPEYRKHRLEKSKKQYQKLKKNPPATLEGQIEIVLWVLLVAYGLHHSYLLQHLVRLK